MTVNINAEDAMWNNQGNLLVLGFGVYGDTNVGSGANSGAALLFFQNNSGGTGVYWNKQFVDSTGTMITFGNGGTGGYPNDNADQSAPLNGSYANYTVKVDSTGALTESVQYLDARGNPLTNLGSIGTNPQVLTGNIDPNILLSPIAGFKPGADDAAGGVTTFANSQAIISTVPEPSAYAFAMGGLGLLVVTQRMRRTSASQS